MKHYAMVLVWTCAAAAQSTTNTYISDINGRTVESASVASTDGQHTDLTRSINGREIPLQQTETRILRQDANGSLTETVVRRYDRNGQLASTQKTVTEEQKRAGGSTSRATTYMSDLNGQMRETERKTVDTETHGAVTNTQTQIDRPSLSGDFQTVEKRAAVAESTAEKSHEDETVYRRSDNGSFELAERKVADTTRNGSQTTENSQLYQPIANVASLQLARQQVTTTVAHPDGSETQQVDYYLPALPGVARTAGSSPQLWEQDTVQRRRTPDGKVVETVNARRTDPNHPNRLGPPEQLSETVCRGNCAGK